MSKAIPAVLTDAARRTQAGEEGNTVGLTASREDPRATASRLTKAVDHGESSVSRIYPVPNFATDKRLFTLNC